MQNRYFYDLEQLGVSPFTPMPFDVVFTLGNPAIKTAQKMVMNRFASYTHVAIMVGTTQLCEAMMGKTAAVYDFETWSKARYQRNALEQRAVLRKKSLDISQHVDFFRTECSYYLHEEYSLRALWKSMEHEGTSVCSSLVLKILLRAGIAIDGARHLRRAPTPSTLFRILTADGFESIDYRSFEKWASKSIVVYDALAAHRIALLTDRLSSEKAKLVEKILGWSSVVTDHIKMNRLPLILYYIHPVRKSVFDVFRENARYAHRYAFDLASLENGSALNWQPLSQENRLFQIRQFRNGAAAHLAFLCRFMSSASALLDPDRAGEGRWLPVLKDRFSLGDAEARLFLEYFIFKYVFGESADELARRDSFNATFPLELSEIPRDLLSDEALNRTKVWWEAFCDLIHRKALILSNDNKRLGAEMHERSAELSSFFGIVSSCCWEYRVAGSTPEDNKSLHRNVSSYLDFLRGNVPVIYARIPFPSPR